MQSLQVWLAQILAWREVKFELRAEALFLCDCAISPVSFLAFKWLETSRQAQARPPLEEAQQHSSSNVPSMTPYYRRLPTARR
jgi:hypothetical protein